MIHTLSRADVQAFLMAHAAEDPARVALLKQQPEGVAASLLASQLKARQKAKEKLPFWHGREGIIFPHGVALEQCSSETTALWKAGRFSGTSFADLTGGTGVDTFFISRSFGRSVYVESNAELCKLASHNFKMLGSSHIEVINASAEDYLKMWAEPLDLIYVDPDRRASGKRAIGFTESTPDMVKLMPKLRERAKAVLVKASPMMDLAKGTGELQSVAHATVLAVNNECREVLFYCDGAADEYKVEACHLHNGREYSLVFSPAEEAEVNITYSPPQNFIYDPNVALLKAGAYKTVAARYGVKKLHLHTHLYTANELLPDFPGRVFRLFEVLPFSTRVIKSALLPFSRGHVFTRNFPLEAAELQRRLGLKEGEDGFVIGITALSGDRVLLLAERVTPLLKPASS